MLDLGPEPWRSASPAAIGIRGIGWYLGDRKRLANMPCMLFDPGRAARYEARGYKYYTQSTVDEAEMAVRACSESFRRSGLCPADIDAVVIGWSEHRFYPEMQQLLGLRIVRTLGFSDIHMVGICFAGCCGYPELLRMARSLVVSEGYRNVLVVEVDRCNPDNDDDRLPSTGAYVFGDGAAACVVTTDRPEFLLRSLLHICQSLPGPEAGSRIQLAHRPANMRSIADRALRHAGVRREQIKQFFTPNASMQMCREFIRRAGLAPDRHFLSNLHWIGHPWSCDTVINLYSHCQYEPALPGETFMHIGWSTGSMSAMVLERTGHPMALDPPEFPFVQLGDDGRPVANG